LTTKINDYFHKFHKRLQQNITTDYNKHFVNLIFLKCNATSRGITQQNLLLRIHLHQKSPPITTKLTNILFVFFATNITPIYYKKMLSIRNIKNYQGKNVHGGPDLADWMSLIANPVHRSPISGGDGPWFHSHQIYASKYEKFCQNWRGSALEGSRLRGKNASPAKIRWRTTGSIRSCRSGVGIARIARRVACCIATVSPPVSLASRLALD
jgi:hypothetical protein